MNFIYGLIPAITPLVLVACFWFSGVIKARTAAGLSFFIIFVTTMLSVQTYGPRNQLNPMQPLYSPEPVDVITGSQLIPKKDRIGQFDEDIE